MGINVFWSDDDEGYIATDDTRPGCSAFGETEDEARRELIWAQEAWDEARRKAEQ